MIVGMRFVDLGKNKRHIILCVACAGKKVYFAHEHTSSGGIKVQIQAKHAIQPTGCVYCYCGRRDQLQLQSCGLCLRQKTKEFFFENREFMQKK